MRTCWCVVCTGNPAGLFSPGCCSSACFLNWNKKKKPLIRVNVWQTVFENTDNTHLAEKANKLPVAPHIACSRRQLALTCAERRPEALGLISRDLNAAAVTFSQRAFFYFLSFLKKKTFFISEHHEHLHQDCSECSGALSAQLISCYQWLKYSLGYSCNEWNIIIIDVISIVTN